MDPLVMFLKEDILLEEKTEVNKIRRNALRFQLSKDQKLYKHFISGPYLPCVHLEASELILEELHEEICRSHTGGRSLSHRAIIQGYWWPNMNKEAHEYVKKCDHCQRFVLNIHQPRRTLNPLSSPWPFTQWGLDIVGPFPKAAGNKRYLLVGINYFTKWVEAESLANIRDVDVKRFVWKNIVTWFGVPHSLILYEVFSSIAKLLGGTITNWELRINILPQPTPRGMGKPKLSIRSLWEDLKRDQMTRREGGWKSCHMSYGRIEQHPTGQLERPPS